MKRLIVNADDFGMCSSVNRGIIHAHENGIVTSASLMVRGSAAEEAAQYRGHLSVGLHVELCEWVCENYEWKLKYAIAPLDDPTAVDAEVRRQLDRFRQLTGRNPTHLDSHQHAHRDKPVRGVMQQLADELKIPLRQCSPRIRYSGKFYGQSTNGYPYPQGVSVESLLAIVRSLPEGVTELACHPAVDAAVESTYREERVLELHSLCDPRVREEVGVAGISLCSFQEIEPYGVQLL